MRDRFRELHEGGIFVMPNPWDIGSALVLASMGFPALATTSLGHAATLGRRDQQVTREELLTHVEGLVTAVNVPINVDAERCFGEDPAGVAETVQLLAQAGAAGFSIEDYDPATNVIDSVATARDRVAAAAQAAKETGMVLTARTENHRFGNDDLDDTITRLVAYREAGADVAYAPGLRDLAQIARVVKEVGVPVNVLSLINGPSVSQLASVGVRRVSTGGGLCRAALGALESAGRELLEQGTSTYLSSALSAADLDTRFDQNTRGRLSSET